MFSFMYFDYHLFYFFLVVIYFQLGKAYFELQPSWFDTLSNNAGCLNVKNFPVTAKDLEVMKNAKSSSSEPAEGIKKETCKIRLNALSSPHLRESKVF